MNKDIRRSVLMELESDAGSGESLLAGRLGLLGDLKVDLDARVGSVRLSLSALGGLKAGEVVTLDSQPAGRIGRHAAQWHGGRPRTAGGGG